MKVLRTLEIAWLCIALFAFGTTAYQFFAEDSSAVFMLVITVAASLMYLVRKKQRIKFDRQTSKEDTTVHYH